MGFRPFALFALSRFTFFFFKPLLPEHTQMQMLQGWAPNSAHTPWPLELDLKFSTLILLV